MGNASSGIAKETGIGRPSEGIRCSARHNVCLHTRAPLRLPPVNQYSKDSNETDGRWIVFDGQQPNQPAKVYVVPVNGGKPQALFQSDRDMRDADWSGHGNRLVVSVATGPRGSNDRELLVVKFASRQTTKIPGSTDLAMCRWSPDGRFISATSDDGTQLKLWDVRAEKWTVIAHGLGLGISVWSPDSRFLYFQDLHEAGEPLYRYNTLLERVEPVEDFSAYLKSGVPRCALFGVAPDGSPIIGFTRSFYDLYAAEVRLP